MKAAHTSAQQNLNIGPLDPDSAAAQALLAASDRLMAELYPALNCSHLESAAALRQASTLFLGVWVGSELAGCGAVKRRAADSDGLAYGEIKRLFVYPAWRGRGLSRLIMQALEQALGEQGIQLARLETGIRQPEALALYASLGYQWRGPFGGGVADETGVFMEKTLR